MLATACLALHTAALPWGVARGALVMVAIASAAAYCLRVARQGSAGLPGGRMAVVAIVWLAWACVAAAAAPDRHTSVHGAIWHGVCALILLCVASRPGDTWRMRAAAILVVSATTAAVAALLMVASGLTPDRVAYMLKDQNVFGAYLLLAVPLAVWRAWAEPSGRLRTGLFACAAALIGCLAATGSRGALAGLGVGGALAWAVGGADEPGAARARTAAALAVAAFFLTPPLLRSVFADPAESSSMPHRFFIWETSAQMAAKSPVTGVGPGNYRLAYLSHRPVRYRKSYALAIPADAHSDLMDALARGGVPGLLLSGGLIVLALRRTYVVASGGSDGQSRALGVALLAALGGWAANGLLNSSMHHPAVAPMLFAVLGLVAGFERPVTPRTAPGAIPRWAAAIAILCVLSYAGQRALRAAIAHTLVVTAQLPSNLAPLVGGGEALNATGQKMASADEAVGRLLLACRIDPTYNVPYQVVGAVAATSRPDVALAALEQSVELVPTYAGSHHALGVLLLGMGEQARAEQELTRAAQLDPYNGYYRLDLARALRHTRPRRALRYINHAGFYLGLAEEVARGRFGVDSDEAGSLARTLAEVRQLRKGLMEAP